MKKSYITPGTTALSFVSGMVCSVGSIHGNASFQYGGAADNSDPAISPM